MRTRRSRGRKRRNIWGDVCKRKSSYHSEEKNIVRQGQKPFERRTFIDGGHGHL